MDRPRIAWVYRAVVDFVLVVVGVLALWQYFGYGLVGALYLAVLVLVVIVVFNAVYARKAPDSPPAPVPGGGDIEPLCTETVKVAAGVHVELPLLLQNGERVEGTATERYGEDFDWFLFDDKNYALFYDDKGGVALREGLKTAAAHVEATIPHSGTWHLVLDARNRKRRRRIDVRLSRTPKFVVDAEAAQRARRIAFRPQR